jgi:N-acyl-phosphatidylethanolamine-hydrolysing phospholipase D
VVPDGHRDWFKSESIDRVIEMKWWDHYPVTEKVTISCLPAQHWSKRTAFDDMHALWSGWGVFGSTKKLFFAGDTGYCPGFKEIGDKYGPFDLALIPIGAYEPRWMMRCQHVDPIEAVSIHQDIKSKQSIGMHWGTWVLTDEHVLEPPQKLATELAARELDPKSFVALYHGQSFDTASGPAGGRAFGLNDDAEAESSAASSSSPEDAVVEHEKAPRKSKH